jgi:hypothetical protein
VGAWLHSPQRQHSVSSLFLGPTESFESFTPARAFDAILYLDRVSALEPLSSNP